MLVYTLMLHMYTFIPISERVIRASTPRMNKPLPVGMASLCFTTHGLISGAFDNSGLEKHIAFGCMRVSLVHPGARWWLSIAFLGLFVQVFAAMFSSVSLC